jgi:hypothetical protein
VACTSRFIFSQLGSTKLNLAGFHLHGALSQLMQNLMIRLQYSDLVDNAFSGTLFCKSLLAGAPLAAGIFPANAHA